MVSGVALITGLMWINFVDQANAANHYTTLLLFLMNSTFLLDAESDHEKLVD